MLMRFSQSCRRYRVIFTTFVIARVGRYRVIVLRSLSLTSDVTVSLHYVRHRSRRTLPCHRARFVIARVVWHNIHLKGGGFDLDEQASQRTERGIKP